MAQTLLLGLGGTGSKVVNYVAADLRKKGVSINDGNICCAVLDTNENDRKKIRETGVGVPVIGLSKDRIVDDYIKMYSGARIWMPVSPTLLKESMRDGAAQMRTKSRLAFLDTIEDGTIHQLEAHINRLFDRRDDAKIRVMIVSSLAGGTGSGMFIQTALWLRKFFASRGCTVTLRGIFLLPDIFIDTLADIRNDNTETQSLYANAYGAIRELNAITKIKTKGMKPILPVRIDNLFDSESGQPDGQAVYDYSFFIDNVSEGGSVLTTLNQYEQVVARLVYMQLYAPMHDDLYSEEDNLFKRFELSPEPVFGSCGTAKAVYPSDDVLRYCAMRAAKDSLSTGWRKIDEEIDEKQRRENEREKDGVVLTHRIAPRAEYMRLFEAKSSKAGTQIGHDRMFVNIANDVKNEKRITGEKNTVSIKYSDKVEDFIKSINGMIAATIDTKNPGGLQEIELQEDWEKVTTDTVNDLLSLVDEKRMEVNYFIAETESKAEEMAQELLDLVCPTDMGDINQDNESSLFGFLTKKDDNNETYFVHPIAVRYLLYKLASSLEKIKKSIDLDTLRQDAENGYSDDKPKISFDNPKTRSVEDDAVEYLNSRRRHQNEARFIKEFKSLYAQHNKGQKELCRAYAIALLKYNFAVMMSKRVESITVEVEKFFKNLIKVSNSLDDAIAQNIRKNEQKAQKIIYVCASGKDKEALYKSLMFNTDKSDVNINAMLVRALYGQFCSKESPESRNNAAYKGRSVENTFFREMISTYERLIHAANKNDIDLDIYSAVCKSTDIIMAEEEKEREKEKEDLETARLDIDVETGEDNSAETRHDRYVEAMRDLVDSLMRLGSPFLRSDNEQPEDADEHLDDDGTYNSSTYNDNDARTFTPIKKHKTFWGFSPAVVTKCPELATILGVDVESQKNSAYADNELDCYRAVYGIQAGYIENFNELKNGAYFRNYSQVVRRMMSDVAAGHPEGLVHTPHLDKTWHLFLPYITPEKQEMEEKKFYRLFWLAVAYGMLSISNDGKFMVVRTRETPAGHYEKTEPVSYEGRDVGKVDILKLLASLKLDGAFMADAEPLEGKFNDECNELDNYEGTEFLRGKAVRETLEDSDQTVKKISGGLASKLDTNALTIIVRYMNTPGHSDDVAAMLIQTLEELCRELVAPKYERNQQDTVRAKGYELCRRIYAACQMKDKDLDLIRHWNEF